MTRYFDIEQSEIEGLSNLVNRLSSEIDGLEEEHGGEEGCLSAVGNKTDAQTARREALIEIWESMDPAGFAQYTNASSDWEALQKQLAELEAEPRIQGLTNARGKITQKAINARMKATAHARGTRDTSTPQGCYGRHQDREKDR